MGEYVGLECCKVYRKAKLCANCRYAEVEVRKALNDPEIHVVAHEIGDGRWAVVYDKEGKEIGTLMASEITLKKK